jgi:hypothetical protein
MTKYCKQVNPRQAMKKTTIANATTARVENSTLYTENGGGQIYKTTICYRGLDILMVWTNTSNLDVVASIRIGELRTSALKRRLNDMFNMMTLKAQIVERDHEWRLIYTAWNGEVRNIPIRETTDICVQGANENED